MVTKRLKEPVINVKNIISNLLLITMAPGLYLSNLPYDINLEVLREALINQFQGKFVFN